MRRASKTDRNHVEIMQTFRAHGFSVLDLSAVGKGCPDLLCANEKKTVMVEVKDGLKPPSQRQLNDKQKDFHAGWKGDIAIITTVQEATDLASALRNL